MSRSTTRQVKPLMGRYCLGFGEAVAPSRATNAPQKHLSEVSVRSIPVRFVLTRNTSLHAH